MSPSRTTHDVAAIATRGTSEQKTRGGPYDGRKELGFTACREGECGKELCIGLPSLPNDDLAFPAFLCRAAATARGPSSAPAGEEVRDRRIGPSGRARGAPATHSFYYRRVETWALPSSWHAGLIHAVDGVPVHPMTRLRRLIAQLPSAPGTGVHRE
jgi:hypothetical protein